MRCTIADWRTRGARSGFVVAVGGAQRPTARSTGAGGEQASGSSRQEATTAGAAAGARGGRDGNGAAGDGDGDRTAHYIEDASLLSREHGS